MSYQPNQLEINGIKLDGTAIVNIFDMVTKPHPDRWYKFRISHGLLTITVKMDEEPHDGSVAR